MGLRRALIIYLSVVSLLALAHADVNVLPGRVYEVNVFVIAPLDTNATWLGIYGDIGTDYVRRDWTYFSTPFGSFTVSPPPGVSNPTVSVSSGKAVSIPIYIPNHWYAAISTLSDVNLYDLEGTCDTNIDALIPGTFAPDYLPSKTFSSEANVLLNGKEVCVREAYVTPANIPVLLARDGNVPVYISPVGLYTVNGSPAEYVFLASAPGSTTFYLYLLRNTPECGDYVCDPGEETNCPSDCVTIKITADKTSADVNVNQSAQFILTLHNETNTINVDVNVVISGSAPPGSSTYTYTLGKHILLVKRLDTNSTILTVTPHVAGTFTLRAAAYLGGVEVDHVTLTVVAHAPPPPPEENATGGGAPPPPPPEENLQIIPIEGGGYWIPSLKCISNIQVVGPDRVQTSVDRNTHIGIILQNAGTCDENIHVTVKGVPSAWVSLSPTEYHLKGGESVTLPLSITPKQPGIYNVTVTGKGYTGGYQSFQLLVSPKGAAEAGACKHDVIIVAPEEISIKEGQEVNGILISNAGTCREPVTILVRKKVGGMEVVLDKKEFYLSPGEKYVYHMPKLASGDYELFLSAGNASKQSKIHVLPPPVLGGFSETLVRMRWALLLVMFIILIGAIGYVRYRYLR